MDQGQTLSGNGVVVGDLLNRGTLSPGNSPGIVNITGDTVLDPAGSLVIQIGGLNAGPGSPILDDGYDQFNVSGAATLGGTLQIELINDFVPQVGDSFSIMNYGSATGTFDTVNGLVIGDGLVFKLEQGPTELRLTVLDPSDIMSIIDTVFSGKTTSFSETVTPGDVQLGGVLSVQSPSMTFTFTYASGVWTGTIHVEAGGATFQIGSALSATISDTNSDGIALTGDYSLSGTSIHGGTFSLTADKLTLDIPSLLTADALGSTIHYSPDGAASQEFVHLDNLSIAILPLQDTTFTVDDLSVRGDGFSLSNATFTTSSVEFSSVISIQTLSITFDNVDYSTTSGLQGTFGVSAASAVLFPGQDAFTATVTSFSGSYALNTGALSLGADSVELQVGTLLKLTAQSVSFDLEPFQVAIGAITVTSPRFPQLSGSASGLVITSSGFSVSSATLSSTGSVSIGPVLTIADMSITATSFGYTVGAGASFNGALTVSVGTAELFPGKALNASATGIVVTVNLSPGHEGELSFAAATVSFTLKGVFEASASSVSINPNPAARRARLRLLPDQRGAPPVRDFRHPGRHGHGSLSSNDLRL